MENKEAKPKVETTSAVYIATTGLNYGNPEVRVEAGQEARNLPIADVAWLLETGAIKPIKKQPKKVVK